MSHTFETVMKTLGDKAQLVGGVITVYENGKHTDVGRIDNSTGVFTLTAEGLLIVEGEPTPKKRGAKDKAPVADVVEPELAVEDIPLE